MSEGIQEIIQKQFHQRKLYQSQKEKNMTKYYGYTIPCTYDRVYKGNIQYRQKVRLEENCKVIIHGETMKSRMADHVWKKKDDHQLLWNKVKLIIPNLGKIVNC